MNMSELPLYMSNSRLAELELVIGKAINSVFNKWIFTSDTKPMVSARLVGETGCLGFEQKLECYSSESKQVRIYFAMEVDIVSILNLPSEEGPTAEYIKPRLVKRLINSFGQSIIQSSGEDFFITDEPYSIGSKHHELLSDIVVSISFQMFRLTLILDRALAEKLISRSEPMAKGNLADRRHCVGGEQVKLGLFLDGAPMSLYEVSNLKQGQTIVLSARVSEALSVRLGNNKVANAFVGKKDKHKALIITS